MMSASLPKTLHERKLEIHMLAVVMDCLRDGATLQEVLNAIERVRFTTIELALEVQKHGT